MLKPPSAAEPAVAPDGLPEPAATGEEPSGAPGRGVRFSYFGLMVAASAVGLLKNLVFAGVLGAQELAYYGLALLVLQFGTYVANLGILNGLNFELPIAYGRGDSSPDRAAERALGAICITTAITAAVYLVLVFAIASSNSQVRIALALGALLVAVTTLAEFYVLMLRVRRKLVPLSATYLSRAALALALGAVAGSVWGFKGVVFSEIAALVLTLATASALWLPRLRPRRPRLPEALALIRIGIPLSISNLVVAGTYTIDRVFVAGALPDQFGQYTFASIVVMAGFAFSGMVNQFVAPQVLFEHGAGLELRDVRARMLKITIRIALGAALGFGVLLGLVAIARSGPLSDYGPGLDVMPILYLGAAIAVLNIYSVALYAARRFTLVMVMTVLGVVVAVAGGAVITATNPTLEGYAWLFVAAQATSTLALATATEVVFKRLARG